MNVRSLLIPLVLLGGLGLSCARHPAFSYEVPQGPSLATFRGGVALDPRSDIIWRYEGLRPVRAPEYQTAVIKELQAKGYTLVAPEEAELWLEVVVFVPTAENRMRGVPSPEYAGSDSMEGNRGRGRGGHGGGGGAGEPARSGKAYPPGPEVTLVVKFLTRKDLQTRWFGSAAFPETPKGTTPTLLDTAEGRIHQMLEPLPPQSR